MGNFTLFGKLLGYPDCCIDSFNKGEQFLRGDFVSYDGYVPCAECSKKTREELETVIGRSVSKEPAAFQELMTVWRKGDSEETNFKRGVRVYSGFGQGDFFKECWKASP